MSFDVAARRNTRFPTALLLFYTPQVVFDVSRAFGDRVTAAQVVMHVPMLASSLRSNRRLGPNVRRLLPLRGACHVQVDKLLKIYSVQVHRALALSRLFKKQIGSWGNRFHGVVYRNKVIKNHSKTSADR